MRKYIEEIRKPTMYRGYKIMPAAHPTPVKRDIVTYDILDGDRIRKPNISTIELCTKVSDTMIKYGYWIEKSSNAAETEKNEGWLGV